ncbi:flagellar hook-associated protein FlgK [Piscibacillus halophilus]|uniref:Flagellar hook-associated protein 1 n=1 Tax=Piscibacillus halophilus TaxID=571933 RepID=A0A1H9EJE0_9BACI|nr:flagellar hook-associated protein FlgK [Piscibacillus halophilus]SEQ25363.1 flagellar hook-associated protein 1 FlgK [Piscibacillus halophilus]
MPSTFHGLEVARRALFTQQSALHTTSHNIANANTHGYSRQRVQFEQTSPYPAAARNRPEIPGQMGTGVEAGQVERIRDAFLDFQYRTENNKNGYWGTRADALSRMEDIMNEPSDEGLAKSMDQFWESLQNLATHPEDGGVRRTVMQRATALSETFQYIDRSLKNVQGELTNQLDTNGSQVNSILNNIQKYNDQINEIEPNGYLPNDLYDKRDALIDELSQYVNIKVDKVGNGGNSKATAEGIAKITLLDENGNPMKDENGEDINLISESNDKLDFSFEFTEHEGQKLVSKVNLTDSEGESLSFNPSDFNSTGVLKATMDANGHVTVNEAGEVVGEPEGDYYEMVHQLNKMAYEFSKAFNDVHEEGYTLEGEQGGEFFDVSEMNEFNAASVIKVSDAIKNNENNIAVSSDGAPGDGQHALELDRVRDMVSDDLLDEDVDLDGKSVQKFYESMIGDLGIKAEEANQMESNTNELRMSVENNRQSVSGVSLDEEMANMIKFQHAYNAAARSLTVVDEMLDRVINQMGIVGR